MLLLETKFLLIPQNLDTNIISGGSKGWLFNDTTHVVSFENNVGIGSYSPQAKLELKGYGFLPLLIPAHEHEFRHMTHLYPIDNMSDINAELAWHFIGQIQ